MCRETLDWALREMRGPEGGFYAALDADSEGVEGRFYVWTLAQLRERSARTPTAAIAWLRRRATQGNFTDPHHPEPGLNVLQARGPRPDRHSSASGSASGCWMSAPNGTRPGLDDKRLTSWNALMICALADAGATLEEPRYLDAAVACAEFLLGEMRDAQGRLLRTYNDGQARIGAYLEDHAFLLEALLALFEATCEERWFTEARALADTMIARFADPRARRLLLDRLRRRAADRAAQGPRGLAHPLRRLQRGAGPAAPGAADGRGRVRASRGLGAAPARGDRAPPSELVRAPAAGAALALALHAGAARSACAVPGAGACRGR